MKLWFPPMQIPALSMSGICGELGVKAEEEEKREDPGFSRKASISKILSHHQMALICCALDPGLTAMLSQCLTIKTEFGSEPSFSFPLMKQEV